MPTPEDSPQALGALRLGWYVAEVRGRNRPGGRQPIADPMPNRLDHVLPMRIERTGPELRIEAQAVLGKLAGVLGVDAVTVNGQEQDRTTVVDQRARALAQVTPGSQAAAEAWDALAASLCDRDAHAQGHPGRRVRHAVRGLPARSRAGRGLLGAQSRCSVRSADPGLLGVPARRAPLRGADPADRPAHHRIAPQIMTADAHHCPWQPLIERRDRP